MSHRLPDLLKSQTPPSNEHAERAVLGAILNSADAYNQVCGRLTADDFYHPAHQIIWTAMSKIGDSGPLDPLILSDELTRRGLLEKAGGLLYLEHLADESIAGRYLIAQHAQIIIDHAARRRLVELHYEHTQAAMDASSQIDDMLQSARSSLDEIARTRIGDTPTVIATSIVSTKVSWLWPGRIPLSMITVLDGDPGLGKSMVTIDLAARLSTGRAMPDGSLGPEACDVLLVSAEDDPACTIRPRLDAAGADVARIHLLRPECPWTLGDVQTLRSIIEPNGIKLVVVDPLMAYLPAGANAYRDQDVRTVLRPIAAIASDMGVAVLIVRHLTKSGGANPIYRGGGSIGIIGAARSGMLITKHPNDDNLRVLAPTKSNLGQSPSSLGYQIESVGAVARVVWTGIVADSAEELLESADMDREERGALAEAVHWLQGLLANGPIKVQEVKRQAQAADISERTLKRARSRLRAQANRTIVPGPWYLALPS